MTWQNAIPRNSFQGNIDGISIEWNPRAIHRLLRDANHYGVQWFMLKGATENVAAACARRLRKTSVRIMYVKFYLCLQKEYIEHADYSTEARFTTQPLTQRMVK